MMNTDKNGNVRVYPVYIQYKDGKTELWLTKKQIVHLSSETKGVIVKSGLPIDLIDGKWTYIAH